MKRGAIIVAGGKGLRMGGDLPKQYLKIGGIPILARTVRAFQSYSPDIVIVLSVPADNIDFVQELLSTHCPITERIIVTSGGESRTESVYNGIQAIPHDIERIAIHDGVRPFVSPALLDRLWADSSPSVLPMIPCTDSVRLRDTERYRPLDRSLVGLVQTPQVFDAATLRQAYALSLSSTASFTDDASLVEALVGIPPTSVQGDELNIKITTPKDLVLAEWIARTTD